MNLGTGRGHSVLEVIEAASRVAGVEASWVPADRRPGDPPKLVAAPGAAAEVLDFDPVHTDLDAVVASAWAYYKAHPERLLG